MTANRRSSPRMAEEDSVAVTILAAPAAPKMEDHVFFCRTSDLSAGGLKLGFNGPVPVGSVLKMTIALPDPPRSFTMMGEIVWASEEDADGDHPYFVGIEFSDEDEHATMAWAELIGRRGAT